jgi:hypothetical protein
VVVGAELVECEFEVEPAVVGAELVVCGHGGQTSSVLLSISHSSPLNRLNGPWESGPMATVRLCREAVQLTRVVQYPILSEKGTESVWHRPLR